jgi:hypothetical protein
MTLPSMTSTSTSTAALSRSDGTFKARIRPEHGETTEERHKCGGPAIRERVHKLLLVLVLVLVIVIVIVIEKERVDLLDCVWHSKPAECTWLVQVILPLLTTTGAN